MTYQITVQPGAAFANLLACHFIYDSLNAQKPFNRVRENLFFRLPISTHRKNINTLLRFAKKKRNNNKGGKKEAKHREQGTRNIIFIMLYSCNKKKSLSVEIKKKKFLHVVSLLIRKEKKKVFRTMWGIIFIFCIFFSPMLKREKDYLIKFLWFFSEIRTHMHTIRTFKWTRKKRGKNLRNGRVVFFEFT